MDDDARDDPSARYTPLRPDHAWEVPVTPVALVAAALAVGRPGALTEPRLDGLSDDEVTSRYARLRTTVLTHVARTGADRERFQALESARPTASPNRWETWVAATGVCDDAGVVRDARRLWEALGPNEYALTFTSRPRTARGFVEGRAWLSVAVTVTVLLVLLAVDDGAAPAPWWLWIGLAVAWGVTVVVLFRRRLRRLDRVGGAELPHV